MNDLDERLRAELNLPSRDKIQGGFDVLLQIRSWVKLCRIPPNPDRPSAREFEGFIANLYSEYERALAALPEASPRTDERVRQLPGKWCTPVASSRPELEAVYRQCAEDLKEAIEQCDIDARTIAADFIKAKIVHITDPDLKGILFSWAEDLIAAVPEASPAHDENCQWWHRLPCTCEPPRCPICDWPLKQTVEEGCVPGNCSYRPHEGTAEYRRIEERKRRLAAPLAQQHTHTPDHYDYCCSCKWVCSWVTSQDYGPHPDEACGRQHAEHVREVSDGTV